jgi:hypothetical protein
MYCLTSFEFAQVIIVLHFLIGQTVTVLEGEFEQQLPVHMYPCLKHRDFFTKVNLDDM